eukprot:Skav214898  [mRNA]  locus=scaffold1561:94103:94504:+ [translate_table: standard]
MRIQFVLSPVVSCGLFSAICCAPSQCITSSWELQSGQKATCQGARLDPCHPLPSECWKRCAKVLCSGRSAQHEEAKDVEGLLSSQVFTAWRCTDSLMVHFHAVKAMVPSDDASVAIIGRAGGIDAHPFHQVVQ